MSTFQQTSNVVSCKGCQTGKFSHPISMAFQPIIDLSDRRVLAYEALVRGPAGEGAGSIISLVNDTNRYGFDQACRVKAIETASTLNLASDGALLSINFMPNAVYRPEACIRSTFEAARRSDFPLSAIMFEFTENEEISDPAHLKRILSTYREMGFRTAVDDFGAGHSGLNLLIEFQPDFLKLDMKLIRGVDKDFVRRSIIKGVASIASDLGVKIIAEGVETDEERRCIQDIGIDLFQGYLFARPGFECLPGVEFPAYSDASA